MNIVTITPALIKEYENENEKKVWRENPEGNFLPGEGAAEWAMQEPWGNEYGTTDSGR